MQVGDFRLEERIGAGGMGEVWRARHASGVTAAVKFDLHPPDDDRREAFFHEVRLVAGLDHPNCVMVFDTGLVTASEARGAGEGPVRAGAPWLAMELARGGSVGDPERAPRTWEEVRHVFRGLLEGLSHAHARGVIHRDIKPGNLLLAGPRGIDATVPARLLDARPLLSDFGIGVLTDRPGAWDGQSVGTPRFMSPEQIEARWRDFGPWTDLYQCGVLLWKLVTGEYPFRQRETVQLYRAHLFTPPGAFLPMFDVPEGLEGYCRLLLAKSPAERPAFASDAAARLLALGDAVEGSASRELQVDPDPDQATVVRSTTGTGGGGATGGERGALDLRLRGVGLGLWGLRPVPLVDRLPIRTALWDALLLAQRTRRPGAVLLQGPEGTGKSRLARWLAEESHAAGLATCWRARHGPVADAESGVAGMVRRELRLSGLDREAAAARLGAVSDDPEPLLRWLFDGADVPAAERHGLAARVMTDDRPRLVWLDDVQFGADSLAFVWHALQRVARPWLFVLTATDHVRPEVARLLTALQRHARVTRLEVGALAEGDHRELVRGMLGLDGALALEVEQRTAGNPRFAVELVNTWVEQGILESGRRGLQLRAGASPALPADLLAVAAGRVEAFLGHRVAADAVALELAAALGLAFGVEEWREAMRLGGVGASPDLLEGALSARLLRSEGPHQPLTFTHALLREHLLGRARAAGRAAGHAAICVDAVRNRPGVTHERLGRLLLDAGRLEEAFEELEHAIDHRHTRGDHRTEHLLTELAEVLSRLGAPDEDPRWGEVLLLRAACHRAHGQLDEAEVLFSRVARDAARYGWRTIEGIVNRDLGRLAHAAGDYEGAIAPLLRAEATLREVGRTETAADCRMALGEVYDRLGRDAEAEAMYTSAIGAFDGARGWYFVAQPFLSLAQFHQRRGRLDAAAAFAAEAVALATRHHLDRVLAQASNLSGELARARGDLVEAERHYHEAVRRYSLYQDDDAHFPILNLGVVRVLLGQMEQARAMVLPLLQEFRRRGTEPVLSAYCCSVLLPTATDDPAVFDDCLAELRAFLAGSGQVDPDIARMCEIAGDLLADPVRRSVVRALAADQRKRLATTA